jgi:hypothetical protein
VSFFGTLFLRRFWRADLEEILESRRYFLIGEKGTGKTAYAVLLANTQYKGTNASVRSLTSTDYMKFIFLKQNNLLNISNYVDAWKVILLLLLSYHIIEKEGGSILKSIKFGALKAAIDDYYASAFSPEVVNALEFVENAETAASLITKYAKLQLKSGEGKKEHDQGFQTNLLFVERKMKDAIGSLKLSANHILFIDGIDFRPPTIDFETYIECLHGLAQAAWYLNTEFLANIRDSKGRVKIVLLLRPDILNELGYQNLNAKVHDNALVLDWRTSYREYRGSRIFRLIDGILGKQQPKDEAPPLGVAWDRYFPYELLHLRLAEVKDNPFIGFLRYSFYRPRDIIRYLLMMQNHVKLQQNNKNVFTLTCFQSCQALYSDYLLGEVRDHLRFYYNDVDFDELTGFFKYLKGASRFSWQQFGEAYATYMKAIPRKRLTLHVLDEGPESFLQFLYSLNVIGYDEISVNQDEIFVHWCFWDRSTVTLNPKVPAGLPPVGISNAKEGPYSTHPGLMRALKVGSPKSFRR